MDPAKTNIESLTTTPGIREQPRSSIAIAAAAEEAKGRDVAIQKGLRRLCRILISSLQVGTVSTALVRVQGATSEAEGPTQPDRIVCIDFPLEADGKVDVAAVRSALPLTESFGAATALFFVNRTDKIAIAKTLPVADEALTVEAWIKRLGGGPVLLRRAGANDEPDALLVTWDADAGQIKATVTLTGGAQNNILVQADAPDVGFWNHKAVRFRSDVAAKTVKLTLFIDGQRAKETKLPFDASMAAQGIVEVGSGGNSPDDDGFIGGVAHLRWWNSARTRTQIRENMYRNLPKNDREDLVGGWPMDNPGLDPAVAKNMVAGAPDGEIAGADWVVDTPPVSTGRRQIGISTGMGVLRFADGASEPRLLASADGLLHLYLKGKIKKPGTNEEHEVLGVAHYDTDSKRAEFSLGTTSEAADQPTEAGELRLAAHEPDDGFNSGAGVSVMEVKDERLGFCRLTLKGPAPAGGSEEIFYGMPRDVKSLSQIVNGLALDDPLANEVISGERVFYDYSGTRPTVRLPTEDGADLMLVTARCEAYPSALTIDKAEVKAGNSGAVSLALTAPEIEVKGKPLKRDRIAPRIEFPEIGLSASKLRRAFSGMLGRDASPIFQNCHV